MTDTTDRPTATDARAPRRGPHVRRRARRAPADVAELETGGQPLERTLALHERGAALLERCETPAAERRAADAPAGRRAAASFDRRRLRGPAARGDIGARLAVAIGHQKLSDLRGTGLDSLVRSRKTCEPRHHRRAARPVNRPTIRPSESHPNVTILSELTGPADLRGLTEAQLTELAAEIRETIIATVAETGGHLGSSLGVVELTIALHRLLESPRDRIVWDTGHQAYPHKLLTGRLERFGTLRSLDGVGGFPRRSESPHDVFDGGHAGTGLSIAEGLAEARDLRHGMERIAVVVGDAALMSGLSLEALNDIGQRKTQMLIVRQRQRDVDQPDRRRVLEVPLADQALERLAPEQERLRPIDRARAGRRPASPRAVAPPARLGRPVRAAGPAVRGPRDHVHRRRAGARHPRADSRRSGAALALPGPTIVHVRTQKGRGYRPASRTRSASTARRCRR